MGVGWGEGIRFSFFYKFELFWEFGLFCKFCKIFKMEEFEVLWLLFRDWLRFGCRAVRKLCDLSSCVLAGEINLFFITLTVFRLIIQ